MLDKLSSLFSYAMTRISILLGVYYVFCKHPNSLNYVAKPLKKNKFFGNNIENGNNQRYYYKSFYIYKLINYR